MAARDILKDFNLFVDGRGYAGNVDEFSPPDLTVQTEDHRAGGMDAPIAIDVGMEALETSFVLSAYDADVLVQWGLVEGGAVQVTARGSVESYDGTVKAAVMRMRGNVTSLQRGTWNNGQKNSLTVQMRLDRYVEELDGVQLHHIDIQNMTRVINGTDQLAGRRAALGI